MGRKPPKASSAAGRSASTSPRPRSAGPSRPRSQSTTAWFQRTKDRINHSSSPSWARAWRSEGRLIRFVAADRMGALGVIEQGLKCFQLEALGGAVRLGQAQARTGADRLRGQRRKPAAQGGALAAAEQVLDVPLDQL